MSTTSNNEQWLELITQCRASGLTDRHMVHTKRDFASTFYYHIRSAQKVEIPADTAVQKQEVVQLPLWKTEQDPETAFIYAARSAFLTRQTVSRSTNRLSWAIRNTLLALRQLC